MAACEARHLTGLVSSRGAVDLVGQDDAGERRPGAELEARALLVEDAHAGDVAEQQVGRELHARKAATHGARQRLREQRLPCAWVVFDDQVPAGQQGEDSGLNDVFLAEDDCGDVGRDAAGAASGLPHRLVPKDGVAVGAVLHRVQSNSGEPNPLNLYSACTPPVTGPHGGLSEGGLIDRQAGLRCCRRPRDQPRRMRRALV